MATSLNILQKIKERKKKKGIFDNMCDGLRTPYLQDSVVSEVKFEVQCSVFSMQYSVCSVHCAEFIVRCTVCYV